MRFALVSSVSVLLLLYKSIVEFGSTGFFNKHSHLLESLVTQIIMILFFAELYKHMDDMSGGKDFGFENNVDAYYFSSVTSSSVGYGDQLPKTKRAKIAVMFQILSIFFVVYPVLSAAFEHSE